MPWDRFKNNHLALEDLEFELDISRIHFGDDYLEEMEPKIQKALGDMRELEDGAIANPDENRRVGHYWLRAPERAPDKDIADAIRSTLEQIRGLAADVHAGRVRGAGGPFRNLLLIGIGGSALGPQFVAQALGHPQTDRLKPHFFDNTDPDGIDRTLAHLDGELGVTLVLVVSKSGGTPETRNGMFEAEAAYRARGLDFSKHAIAVTGEGSKLDTHAKAENWIARLPMWDWVGGRTSELAAVGLLPAALQGFPIDRMLNGAREMDAATRETVTRRNPAALLALMWYRATDGKGAKDMVVLPYKDRLELFSRYLQQLVMESLGKEKDLDGNTVHQGIAVYGNKGSTDQHAYVQQLRDGVHNFFVTFIEVLKDREGPSTEIDEGITAGDYLQGFLLGTRDALYGNGRQSITLTIREVTPEAVGRLIALFERAVGLYGSLVRINPYHQPGVEAGKKAAASILELEKEIFSILRKSPGKGLTAEEIAAKLSADPDVERVFKLLRRLAANERGIRSEPGATVHDSVFYFES